MIESTSLQKSLWLLALVFLLSGFVHTGNAREDSKPAILFGKQIPEHPRLLFSNDDEKRIRELAENDQMLNQLFDLLAIKADELLQAPMIEYSLRDVNYVQDILTISREHVYRIFTLALAYRLSGDEKYARKAEENLINVCNYPNWNPRHYLDVAEMTTAVSVGYDWLHSFLSEDTKRLIQKTIRTHALELAVKEYETGDESSWAKRETNWNVVCNTGMILGALAIAEEDPALAESVIRSGTGFVPNCLKHYDPDGVCYEGPGYWNYTNIYLSLLLKSLNDNLDNDFGISSLSGVSNTVNYYIESVSPGGRVFNFANSGGTNPAASPVFFYFSRAFNQPKAAEFYRDLLSEILKHPDTAPKWHFFLSIPWYDDAVCTKAFAQEKLKVFDNLYNPVAVFRGDTSVRHAIFLTAKGGAPDKAHQQLDVGTFVIETDGIRWTDDLGSDKYSLPGFWDYKPGGQRWDYFRNTNFSHNTLSIDGKLQYSRGEGNLLKHDEVSSEPYCIFDLTTAYTNQASSVLRGFRMLNDDLMLIRDEAKLLPGSEFLEWSVITSADVVVKGDHAELTKEDKKFYIRILHPAGLIFESKAAQTLTPVESPLKGYTILHFRTQAQQGAIHSVQVAMGSNLNTLQQISREKIQPITNW